MQIQNIVVPLHPQTRMRLGRLAQLVQSICLTSRGSAVRIRQRPPQKAISQIFPFWAFSSAGSEHLPYKQRVGGSNPSTPTSKAETYTYIGRLAQLVQSICLTSRGSAVRIRQRPPIGSLATARLFSYPLSWFGFRDFLF